MAGEDPTSRVQTLRRMLDEHGRIDEDLFAPDAVSYRPWDLVAQALAEPAEALTPPRAVDAEADGGLARMLSDAKLTVLDAQELGDAVRIRWRLRGVHAQECFGIRPTGDEVDVTGHMTYRFDDDRIVEVSGAADCSSLGMMCMQIVEAMAHAGSLPACHVGATDTT